MNAVQRIANKIADLIGAGELNAGEPLREVALADRFKTSRTTIREATMLLEFRGLISREPNRGAIVRSPTRTNLSNLQACRRGLEAGAVSIPMSPAALELIGDKLRKLEQATAGGDRVQMMECDGNFHASLVANYGSERLSELFESIYREQSLYLKTLATREGEFERDENYLDEHRHIYHALVAGDLESARRYVSHHINETYSRFSVLLEDGDKQAIARTWPGAGDPAKL